MIEFIHMENFENHPDTKLEFLPGMNVLVGLSDAGKSSTFRAFRWVIANRPLGDWMIPAPPSKDKSQVTKVTIRTTDGHEVTRTKKGTTSKYIVDGKELTGFGTGVPEEVEDALRMTDVNFQPQIELPFLLFDSPGSRAKTLNRISGLSEIDRAMSNAASDLRATRNGLTQSRDELKRLSESYKAFDGLDDEEAQAEKAESLLEEHQTACDTQGKLLPALEKLASVEINERDNFAVLQHLPNVESMRGLLEDKKRQAHTRDSLSYLLGEADKLGESSPLDSRIESLDELKDLYATYKEQARDVGGIESVLEDLQEATAARETCLKQVSKLKALLPDDCPTCGQPYAV